VEMREINPKKKNRSITWISMLKNLHYEKKTKLKSKNIY
jgi:hypothetical protein